MEVMEEIDPTTDGEVPERGIEGPAAAEEPDDTINPDSVGPESKQDDPGDQAQPASNGPVAEWRDEQAGRLARKWRAHQANRSRATQGPADIPPEPEGEPDPRPAAEGSPAEGAGDILADLVTQIMSEVDGLSALLDDALARKFKFGKLLDQAQKQCKALKVDWTGFLAVCGLKERTAREAIRFHKNRAQIEAERHGGAVLTVTAARAALSSPRAKGGPAGPPDPAAGSSPTGDSASPRVLPPPAPEGGEHGETSPRPGARVDLDDDRVVEAAEGPATTPGVVEEEGEGQPPPPVLGDVQAATDDRPSDLEAAEEACEAIMRILAEQIARVESGEADQAIEALRRAAPMILQGFQWLDEALRARGEATE